MSSIGENIIIQCLDKIASLLEPSWWQIFSALSTPIIALMVGYVAYRQYKIDKSRLRRETYPDKIRIYKTVISFISEVIRNSARDQANITLFYENVSEANFLFGDPPNQQIETLYEKAFELYELEALYDSYQKTSPALRTHEENQDYSEILKKRSSLKKWFLKQPNVTAKIFKKELSLIKESIWNKVINK